MHSLKFFCVIGAIVTVIAGVIGHFVYEWSGNDFLAGLFFPVNESTWEHMKLLFFPMLAYALFGGKKLEGRYPGIYHGMFTGILAGLAMIPALFYTYTGILGFDVAWANIAVFVVSVLKAYIVACRTTEECARKETRLLRYMMYALILAFMVFTVYPPKLGIFQSP